MPNSASDRIVGSFKSGFLIAACVLLVACGTTGGPGSEPSGGDIAGSDSSGVRPGTDGAPSGDFDPSSVQDAVPRAHNGKFKASPYTVLGKKYYPLASAAGYKEDGTASWYGTKFHGHKTANGEVYDMYTMSAAHKTLPLPSYVRVTNLANGHSVVVRVNDRGPFHGDRIIDMSYAAARKLDFFGKGTARVRVEALDSNAPVEPVSEPVALKQPVEEQPAVSSDMPTKRMYLQVAALSNERSANSLQERLRGLTTFDVAIISSSASSGQLHKVRIGPLSTLQEVEEVKQQVDNAALGTPHVVYE